MVLDFGRIYDITVTLGLGSIDYPGDTPYARVRQCRIARGDVCDLSAITLSLHSGTHIDSPSHFIEGGRTIDQCSVKDFIRPALVVPVEHAETILPCELEKHPISPGDALLFKTYNSTLGMPRSGVFSEHYVHLSLEAARSCVTKGVGLVGIDYVSVDRFGDESFPVHRVLLGNGILVLEGIDLKDVPPGRYVLCCFPLKIWSGEASPVHAVLLRG